MHNSKVSLDPPVLQCSYTQSRDVDKDSGKKLKISELCSNVQLPVSGRGAVVVTVLIESGLS